MRIGSLKICYVLLKRWSDFHRLRALSPEGYFCLICFLLLSLLLQNKCVVISKIVMTVYVSVTGRFDETVIEERRQCAEDLLQFSANIPALYNSKQLEEFFKVG